MKVDVIKMKRVFILGIALLVGISLTGCSINPENYLDSSDKASYEIATKQDTGNGSIDLLTPTITVDENQLKFITKNMDENKVTFIYVANEKVFEEKIVNNQEYKIDIKDIKDAHRTDYKPKVQLVQYKNDKEDSDIVTFKQVRYKVGK